MDSAPPSPDSNGASSRFDAVVRSLSWEWLEGLSRSLNLEVQLVDTRGSSRLPAIAPSQSALARFVTSDTAGVRAVVGGGAPPRPPPTDYPPKFFLFSVPPPGGA